LISLLLCMLIVCCHAQNEDTQPDIKAEIKNDIPTDIKTDIPTENQPLNSTNITTTESLNIMLKVNHVLIIADRIFNLVMGFLNGYQVLFFLIAIFIKPKHYPKAEPQSIAVLICARNESSVIGDLLSCIQKQNYPKNLYKVFVVADNCTDNTADIAAEGGAVVYERHSTDGIGKGYALRFLLRRLAEDYPYGFDSYLLFDADNLIPPDFFQKMSDALSAGYDIVSSFRNSKNFGDSYVSAALSLWFIGESRFLFQPRSSIGNSVMVGGTGFIVSRKVMEDIGDWHYLTITEDIEFTIDQLIKGNKIGYCVDAQVYDEQPISFLVSMTQRLRWAKGFFQVLSLYGKKLLKNILKGSFACYDLFMIHVMCYIVSIWSVALPILIGITSFLAGSSLYNSVMPLFYLLINSSCTFIAVGLLVVVSEWSNIHSPVWKKFFYLLFIPLFMYSYFPLVIMALFVDVEWKHIPHTVNMSDVSTRHHAEQLPLTEGESKKL